jgi:hypothetical protein
LLTVLSFTLLFTLPLLRSTLTAAMFFNAQGRPLRQFGGVPEAAICIQWEAGRCGSTLCGFSHDPSRGVRLLSLCFLLSSMSLSRTHGGFVVLFAWRSSFFPIVEKIFTYRRSLCILSATILLCLPSQPSSVPTR